MNSSNPSQPPISFAGFIWFWNIPSAANESTRQPFFSIYQNLRQTVQQHSSGPNLPERKSRMVRISAPGKKLLGLVRR
jgi:hypothetical protein